MRKINLDNIQEFTRFKNPVGGFICQIMAVEDVPEKEYLKVFYDIAEDGLTEHEVKLIRATVKDGVDAYLNKNHKQIFACFNKIRIGA